jgi:hypothetical protein
VRLSSVANGDSDSTEIHRAYPVPTMATMLVSSQDLYRFPYLPHFTKTERHREVK